MKIDAVKIPDEIQQTLEMALAVRVKYCSDKYYDNIEDFNEALYWDAQRMVARSALEFIRLNDLLVNI